jgi:hypothetical protein
MQGRDDVAGFVQAFTGSNRFVLDYLVEEVLEQQPPAIQEFLLKTSILERLTGPLCDAVLGVSESASQRVSESASRRVSESASHWGDRAWRTDFPIQNRLQSPPLVCSAISVYRLAVKKPSTIMSTIQTMDRASDFSR